jgi:predicted DNA-binding protein (MmcQ/YjbR family)
VRPEVDARFERPVYARLRRVCQSLPEAEEGIAWGHPNFRVRGRTFCAFEILKGRPSIALNGSQDDVKRMKDKKHFTVTPYGRGVYVSRWLDESINWRELEGLVRRSYRYATAERVKGKRNSRA